MCVLLIAAAAVAAAALLSVAIRRLRQFFALSISEHNAATEAMWEVSSQAVLASTICNGEPAGRRRVLLPLRSTLNRR